MRPGLFTCHFQSFALGSQTNRAHCHKESTCYPRFFEAQTPGAPPPIMQWSRWECEYMKTDPIFPLCIYNLHKYLYGIYVHIHIQYIWIVPFLQQASTYQDGFTYFALQIPLSIPGGASSHKSSEKSEHRPLVFHPKRLKLVFQKADPQQEKICTLVLVRVKPSTNCNIRLYYMIRYYMYIWKMNIYFLDMYMFQKLT